MIRHAAIAALALTVPGLSHAQVLMERNISMELAMKAFEGAVAECKKTGSNDITVVVVDRAGLVALEARANNASPHNLELARRKAYTAHVPLDLHGVARPHGCGNGECAPAAVGGCYCAWRRRSD
jgi:hypothetical protein